MSTISCLLMTTVCQISSCWLLPKTTDTFKDDLHLRPKMQITVNLAGFFLESLSLSLSLSLCLYIVWYLICSYRTYNLMWYHIIPYEPIWYKIDIRYELFVYKSTHICLLLVLLASWLLLYRYCYYVIYIIISLYHWIIILF